MDVVVEPGLLHGPEEIVLDEGGVRLVAPGVAEAVVEGDGAAQADADEVASAQARGQAENLLRRASQAVQEHEQRVRIARLIALGKKGPHRQRLGRLDLRGVKAFGGAWVRQETSRNAMNDL